MEFKTDRVRDEYAEVLAGRRGRLLLPVILLADALSQKIAGKPALLTMIFRTAEEQAAMNRILGTPGARSVHEFWRGFDVRITCYTADQQRELCRRVNAVFVYGGKFKTFAVHNAGTASHLHGQVPDAVAWGRSM